MLFGNFVCNHRYCMEINGYIVWPMLWLNKKHFTLGLVFLSNLGDDLGLKTQSDFTFITDRQKVFKSA